MGLLVLSFIAGVLTIAAPCVLPLLPVIVGGSLIAENEKERNSWYRPVLISISLAASIFAFTLLLKASTSLIGVPTSVWQFISGGIVILLGIYLIWPHGWELFSAKTGFFNSSNKALGSAYKKKGTFGAVLTGVALGPVFSSCSPTYALIVATVLPVSYGQGLIYLLAYSIGLSTALLLAVFVGKAFTSKLISVTKPAGIFRRVMGVLFILVGLAVIFGYDKKFQAYVLEQGWYDPISNLEERLH